MPLVMPTIVGPVSALSSSLRVQGSLPGATVIVLSLTRPTNAEVAKGVAQGGDDRFNLLSGVTLTANDRLVATQGLGSDASATPGDALALAVAPAPTNPAELGFVGYVSHLWECGRYLWIQGALTGATIEVSFNGAVQGHGIAFEDGARFMLQSQLPANMGITARQTTPVGPGPATPGTPESLPPQDRAKLPVPTITQPVYGCQTAVSVSNVYDGADVTLQRGSGITDTAGFDRNALWFNLSKPLTAGDTITAQQQMVLCEKRSDVGPKIPVTKPDGIPAPFIVSPLCAGGQKVRVLNLVPGALVHLDVNGTAYTGMAPANGSGYDFMVAPLPAGTVSAKQELCSVTSPASVAVSVNPHQDITTPVTLVGPLYACGRAVAVKNVHAGAILQVWAKNAQGTGPISDFVSLYATEGQIAVSPYLRQGDTVWVRQWGCGSAGVDSQGVVVQAHAKPVPPTIVEPVISGAASVSVKDVLPGALVEVFVLRGEVWLFAGARIADGNPTTVYLQLTPHMGEQMRARQTICGDQTRPGPGVPVVKPPPVQPVIDSPAPNATGVAINPTYKWHDPGAGGEGKAASFDVQVLHGTTTILPPTTVTTTSLMQSTNLQFSTTYTVQVRAKNSTATTGWASSPFTTTAPPPPPKPTLTSYDRNTLVVKGKDFLPNHSVAVRITAHGTIPDGYGGTKGDLRDNYLHMVQLTSDGSGNISGVADPKTQLDPITIDAYNGTLYYGVYPGEQVTFTATDGRHDATDLTGNLWSNALTITA